MTKRSSSSSCCGVSSKQNSSSGVDSMFPKSCRSKDTWNTKCMRDPVGSAKRYATGPMRSMISKGQKNLLINFLKLVYALIAGSCHVSISIS